MAKGKKQSRDSLDPIQVLRRRPRLSPEDLIHLIHLVNPTGKAVSRVEAEANYALKAGLQSLLIEQHKEHLRVTPGDHEGIVGLHHVRLGLDACHVPLAALEPEARSWAQLHIDIDPEVEELRPAMAPPAGRSTVVTEGTLSVWLQQAQKSVDEYDFEGAQKHLNEAHRLFPNDARPIQRLLELFVDVLGLDSAALALGAGLTPGLLEAEPIRARLALAAARLGKINEAVAWRQGLQGMAAANVDAALANGALARGDLIQAAQHLSLAQKEWKSQPDLLDLAARLDAAQLLSVAPLLEELDRANQPQAESLALAKKILSLHPSNDKARQFIKAAALQSQTEAQQQAVSQLQSCLRDGDVNGLRNAIARAQQVGIAKEIILTHESGLSDLLSARQSQALAENVAKAVAELRTGHSVGNLAQGLRLYVQLVPEGRSLVKQEFVAEDLAWIDAMVSHPTSEARRDRAVEAVLAMNFADARIRNEQYAEALQACEPHRSLLSEHKAGQLLLDRITAGLSASQTAQAQAHLNAAVDALRLGRLDECGSCLSRIKKSSLGATSAALFAETTLELEERRRREQHVTAAYDASLREEHVDAFRLFENLCNVQMPFETEAQRLTFAQNATRHAQVVRQTWMVMDERDIENDPIETAKALSPHLLSYRSDADVLLAQDDATAVICDSWGPFLFIRLVDVVQGTIARLLLLKCPGELKEPEFRVIGGSVWVTDCLGRVLQIELTDGLPRTWLTLGSLAAPDETIENIFVFPDSRALRVNLDKRTGSNRTLVVDLESLRVSRIVENTFIEHVVPGTRPLAVAALSLRDSGRIVSSRGVEIIHFDLPHRHRAVTVAVNPSVAGFVVIASTDLDSMDQATPLYLLVSDHDERGGFRSSVKLHAHPEMHYTLAVDRKGGGIYAFVNSLDEAEDFVLCILTWENGNLILRRTIPAPAGLRLIQSAAAGTVIAIWLSASGLRFVTLNVNTESLHDDSVEELRVPRLDDDWCEPSLVTYAPDQVSPVKRIVADRPDSGSDHTEWARRWQKQTEGSVPGLLALLEAARKSPDTLQEEILRNAEVLDPKHIDVRLARVYFEARKGLWLGEDLISDARTRHKEHLHHLKGLLQFKQGHFDDALAAWQAPLQENSICHLDDSCKLVKVLQDRQGARQAYLAKTMDLAALYGAILFADDPESPADHEAACSALDQPWIRLQRELQTYVRLVRLLLQQPRPTTGLKTFNRALLLATFVHEVAKQEPARNVMIHDHAVAPSALEELAGAANGWLRGLTQVESVETN